MPKISDITAFEILDSRGNPTLKAEIVLDNGIRADAAIPSGASKGSHEAVELRDGDTKRYHGMGVLKAVETITKIIKPKLKGRDPTNQKEIDEMMISLDGSLDKRNLGANSILAVSLAVCRCAAFASGKSLTLYISELFERKIGNTSPIPLFNVINGGLHGANSLSFQEFILIPSALKSFPDRIRMGAEIYQDLKKRLKNKALSTSVGDEGGFSPAFTSEREALTFLRETIDNSSYKYGIDISMGLDIAASTFFNRGSYKVAGVNRPLSTPEYLTYLKDLHQEFKLSLLEDPLSEDEWNDWTYLTHDLGSKTMIIGDDLLCTNPLRLQKAIDQKACNGILIKVNQIGTLTETLNVIRQAKKAGFKVIISHRSGETVDHFIADLAVGVGADFVKFGAPARGERVAKYNRLLEIYKELEGRK